MIQITPVQLSDCPAALQSIVEKELCEADAQILSITRKESTPYKDKNQISRQFRVIMNRANLVSVLNCYDDGVLKNSVTQNELIWGDILEIIRTAPEDSSLAELWKAVPEQTRKNLSI